MAQQRPGFNASTAAHSTRGTHSRASYVQNRDITECLVLLSMAYYDGKFKVAASNF